MCLIAYVPAGKALTREVFDKAYDTNHDGIGVMSSKGVEKFFGQKALKRARNYVAQLADEKLAHAVHWRFATHGTKQLALCHPFKLPNADAYFMHNGVIGSTTQESTNDASDTLLYVNKMTDAPQSHEDLEYWGKVMKDIGRYNKAVVMYPNGHFIILHKEEGREIDGIWYSNQYSLPVGMRSSGGYFTPSRLRQPIDYGSHWQNRFNTGRTEGQWTPYNPADGTGGYYDTRPLGSGPFGRLIYWSDQFNCYGFWENYNFVKLSVGKAAVQDEPTAVITPSITSTSLVLSTADKCPRCQRPKTPVLHHQSCYCEPMELVEWYKKQGIKEALPSGPTLDAEYQSEWPLTNNARTHEGMCEHGEVSWENCRECINRLEQGDSTTQFDKMNPSDRADALAKRIITLKSRVSDK
jgi:hypothetical protein